MKCSNRKFIIAGMYLMSSLCVFSACTYKKQLEKMTMTNTAMGTVIQSTLYVEDTELGTNITKEIQEELERLENECLSWRIDSSEVTAINKSAGEVDGSEMTGQMQEYLQQIWEISKKSEGALDVTIGQVTELWDLDTWAVVDAQIQKDFQEPNAEKLKSLLQNSGYEKVTMQGRKIILPEGMSLDLGAVGKGIACDKVGEFLVNREELAGAVVSVGGSVVTCGSKPDGAPWQVAIVHPRENGGYLGTLSLQGEWYVSTSGDYERYVEKNDKRYHHIMNPKTGYPADSGVCSVTILSDSGLLSDALSTACFVLGVEKGMELVKEFEVEALFVTKELEIVMTEGMKSYFKEK